MRRRPAGRPGAGAGQGFPPTPVKIVDARATPLEDTTEYVATLKSLRSTTIKPQIDGQITQIFVKSGDRVDQGARLMQIDPQRQQAAVSSQEAERAAREANVAYARQQQQRASELFAAGAVSKQELEQAQTALRTAEASLAGAAGAGAAAAGAAPLLHHHRPHLRHRRRRAGARRDAGVVADGADDDRAERYARGVRVRCRSSGRADLKIGLPLRVMSSDGRDTLAATTINFISPSVDEGRSRFWSKAPCGIPTAALRSSQFVRARIVWKTADGLVVPVTAVARINGQYFVFVAEETDGKLVARQRAIKVGPDRRRRLSGARRHQARREGRRLRLAEAGGRRADRAGAGGPGRPRRPVPSP